MTARPRPSTTGADAGPPFIVAAPPGGLSITPARREALRLAAAGEPLDIIAVRLNELGVRQANGQLRWRAADVAALLDDGTTLPARR